MKQVRPKLEPLSKAALEVLHTLEPVVGRIIGTAVLKYACKKKGVEPADLQYHEIPMIAPSVEVSLTQYDRSTDVIDLLLRLATKGEGQ